MPPVCRSNFMVLGKCWGFMRARANTDRMNTRTIDASLPRTNQKSYFESEIQYQFFNSPGQACGICFTRLRILVAIIKECRKASGRFFCTNRSLGPLSRTNQWTGNLVPSQGTFHSADCDSGRCKFRDFPQST